MALEIEAAELAAHCRDCDAIVAALPPRPARTAAEAAAAEAAKRDARDARARFLRRRAGEVYSILTHDRTQPLRADELVYAASDRFPGLAPSRAAVEAERQHPQRDKEGVEIDQGILLCHILSSRTAGLHLVHTMLRPTRAAEQLLARFRADGAIDLGPVRVERVGKAGHVTLTNPSFLNAEDDSTVAPLETAVDLVLLDPDLEVGVLRGGVVSHPKYAGRRVFNAGINLTHLYHGKISFVGFFLIRDLGFVHKLYRGLTTELFVPDEPELTVEKPWIAAVEAFAIGGGCQLLLTMDHVLAEDDSYFNLPARKEGIIPGAANLRLGRAVGDRLARQAILYERGFPAASPEGALLCDEVVPRGGMDAAIERAVTRLTSAGLVSAAANRKALRIAEEPLDVFRRYMALYAREQADCHFSPALIRNLEQNWDAKRRAP
ncbi:MAG TPA: enoyl-CoA hydratase/isomerase family protein [Kofleriaceae bacterium]|nr:enoyl-CoA hydratase/isomerase family protein [Kofleriaceae bacterium]